MLSLGLLDTLDNQGSLGSQAVPNLDNQPEQDNQAAEEVARDNQAAEEVAQDNQAAEEVAQDNQPAEEVAQYNQAELGSLLTFLMLHLPGLEDGSLGEHLHKVVVDLGKLVVDSSQNPAQEEGTGVGLMDLPDQGMVGVHMEEVWNLDNKMEKNYYYKLITFNFFEINLLWSHPGQILVVCW